MCKECGGSGICEHGRRRSHCKECGGSSICEHGRRRQQVQGVRGLEHLRAREAAKQGKECGGGSICEHGRRDSSARSAGL